MSNVLSAARRHMHDLELGRVPHNEKPNAFHYGLLSGLITEMVWLTDNIEILRAAAQKQEADSDE